MALASLESMKSMFKSQYSRLTNFVSFESPQGGEDGMIASTEKIGPAGRAAADLDRVGSDSKSSPADAPAAPPVGPSTNDATIDGGLETYIPLLHHYQTDTKKRFAQALLRSEQDRDILQPRGNVVISGLVEVVGTKGIACFDSTVYYCPSTKSFNNFHATLRYVRPRQTGTPAKRPS